MSTTENTGSGNGNISDQDRIALLCELTRLWPSMKTHERDVLVGVSGVAYSTFVAKGRLDEVAAVISRHHNRQGKGGKAEREKQLFIVNAMSTLVAMIRERIEPKKEAEDTTAKPTASCDAVKIDTNTSHQDKVKKVNDACATMAQTPTNVASAILANASMSSLMTVINLKAYNLKLNLSNDDPVYLIFRGTQDLEHRVIVKFYGQYNCHYYFSTSVPKSFTYDDLKQVWKQVSQQGNCDFELFSYDRPDALLVFRPLANVTSRLAVLVKRVK